MTIINRNRSAALKTLLPKLIALVAVAGAGVHALAVETVFTIDEDQSDLTIVASTVYSGIPLNDSDTQNLGGAVDATFDFGTSGAFPATADLNVTGSTISPLNPYLLMLGFPPAAGVQVDVTGAVADVTTPSPPLTLTRLAGSSIVYEFDASGLDVTLNEGMVVATGAVNRTIDLADAPATGSAPAGTLGSITLTPTGASGPLTMIDAAMELPIMFTQVIDVDGQQVTLHIDGDVVATSSFAVALAGVPGDFDDDLDVDGDDLSGVPDGWQSRYGADLDGADFLIWQQNFGIQPPVLAAVASVPEPAALLLAALAASGLTVSRRRRSF